jgi:hypothetical protein
MASASKPRSLKQQVRSLIEQLPESCTIDDIHYQLYLIDKINRGEESLRVEGGIAHKDIKKRFAKWLTK